MKLATILLVLLIGCSGAAPHVRLTEDWPASVGDYEDVTEQWTRKVRLRGQYQEALELAATFKSPEWRAAHAAKDADARGLAGEARTQRFAQAQAEAAGPYEIQVMLTTWDRRENDLDRGKKSVWRLRILDAQGKEIEPLEIIKDKRPAITLRAEFPAHGDFSTAYIVRFARTAALLGPSAKQIRLRMSGERGGVEVVWESP